MKKIIQILIVPVVLAIMANIAPADHAPAKARSVQTLQGHDEIVFSVAFSPNGQYVLSGSRDNTLKLWEVDTGREIQTFRGHQDTVTSVTFSPNGQYALSGSWDCTLRLWEVDTGRSILTLKGHDHVVTSVAFSPDGQYVLSGSRDYTVKLWELGTGRAIHTFKGHNRGVTSVTFSPDGHYALSGSRDYTVKLWELGTGRALRTFNGHNRGVTSVAFSPDRRYALSGSRDKTFKLWEVATGRAIRTFRGHNRGVTSVAFSPDGQYVLSGSWDKTLKLWQVDTGRDIRTLKGHNSYIFSVAFSPDGQYALSGSLDKTLRLWDLSPYTGPSMVASQLDTTPPKIIITSHGITRSIIPVPKLSETLIAGRAEDLSGVAEVTVNDQPALMDGLGNFSSAVPLKSGKTEIRVMAKDVHGNTAHKLFWVDRREQSKPMASTHSASPIVAKPTGKYHAVIIGINNYRYMSKLETAVNDAREVDRILREHYHFTTNLLINPGRRAIMSTLNKIRRQLGPEDHLLIYYAGHGEFDKAANKAYWLPADAHTEEDTDWIIVDNITSNIRRVRAKHVLVVADSCYSGTLTRNIRVRFNQDDQNHRYLSRMLRKSSRTLMASGSNEPVSDNGGSGHSIFARAFLDGLRNPGDTMFTAEQFFQEHIKERVAGNAEQVPVYSIIRQSGHNGGDFVFIKR